MRRHRWLAAPIVAALGLSACSQTAALAPVSGGRLAEVRFAVNDVLVTQHVHILVAPVCTASGADHVDIHCAGTTLDKQVIVAESTSKDKANLTVRVGARTVFHGAFLAVLDANAAPSS